MSLRRPRTLLALSALVAGCSSGGAGDGSPGVPHGSPSAYTVSYRNQVRLPAEGRALSAVGFATQLRTRDPIGGVRCGSDESPAYKDVASYLGGIAWSHPVHVVLDQSYPPLHYGRRSENEYSEKSSAGAPNMDAGAAPTIERPDLVGVKDGIAIFLSKQHGLMSVDTKSGTPALSCSMKLPGEPKNFLFKGNEIAIIVNARNGHNRSALVRYRVEGGRFSFVDAVRLDDQTIVDARLFDSTIVLYTSWTKPKAAPTPPSDEPLPPPAPIPVGNGGSGSGSKASSGAAAPAGDYGYPSGQRLGSKVLVIQWDDALKVDYEDSLLDDPEEQDPLAGKTPQTKYEPGQIVSERKSFTSFISASDRYIVVPRNVVRTKFRQYQSYSYQVCTNYNPQYEQVMSCNVSYAQRPNPDYRAPAPTTGDYACNGKKLADCIRTAAPSVSQYIYVPTGQTCNPVWRGRCEKYEMRTETYPQFDQDQTAELTIYRFENDSFTKLDSSLAKLVEKPDAISFETLPLSVPGMISSKNQLQFQNGQLYVFGDNALQTLSVAGNSISYLNRLDISGGTQSNAIVFSADRAMISASTYNGYGAGSQVTMLDLTEPSFPTLKTSFSMPGQTTQLILASGGILGPGQVSLEHGGVGRSLQKLTLFSKENGSELDNLLLGTEYDAFATSWLDQNDDQKIRLGADGTRLFLPYSGRHHADGLEPAAHRLAITRIENERLVSERSFNVSDNIIRTAPLDENRSLVFGDSATYIVDRTQGDWSLGTLRELYVPFATYRLDDANLDARVSRVGTKCKITTHLGDARIFAEEQLAEATVPCPEQNHVTGYGPNLFFQQTKTGVRISPDGRSIVVLQTTDVDLMLEGIKNAQNRYCYIDGPGEGASVGLLDAVPPAILCEDRPNR